MSPLVARTNVFVELATGLHYLQGDQWLESEEIIEAYPTGAIARRGAHQVIFSENLNSPVAVDLVTPEGVRLQSRVLGLSYFDAGSGESVMFAETKDSNGEILGNNQVLYVDAFSGADASIRYTYTKSGLEQDVILMRCPAPPESFGLVSATTRLQVLTEFLTEAQPEVRATINPGTGVEDHQIKFGSMVMPQGKAFQSGVEPADDATVVVTKRWVVTEGRNILVEEVPMVRIAVQLETLPPAKRTARLWKRPARQIASQEFKLPAPLLAKRAAHAMQLAKRDQQSGNGFILDYTLLSSQSDQTFAADTTYYVSGTVNLSGATTIEGGTIVKFTNSTSAKINILGTVDCQTGPYRPAIFTAKDDDTIGDMISGSTGSPGSTKYGNGLGLSASGSALSYLRFSYANSAIRVAFESGTIDLAHLQIVNSLYAVDFDGNNENTVYLDNSLFFAITNLCKSGDDNALRARHLTVNHCVKLFNLYGSGSGECHITNSVLAEIAHLGNADVLDGSHNGFYNCTQFGDSPFGPPGSSPFVSLGAAAHYLDPSSGFREQGIVDIPENLLAALRGKTTQPPEERTSDFTSTETLTQNSAVPRDTGCDLDLGYHYDPLDYVVSGRTVSADLTLSGGVAIGTYCSLNSYGLGLDSGNFRSEGNPVQMNWIVRYNMVQEQSTSDWAAYPPGASVSKLGNTALVTATYTGWSLPAGTGEHYYDRVGCDGSTAAEFKHCRFGGGKFTVYPSATPTLPAHVNLINCLWERVYVTLRDHDSDSEWRLYNNLFYRGTLSYRAEGDSPVLEAYDNLFDKEALSGIHGANFQHGYNGYVSMTHLAGTSDGGDKDITAPADYQTGPLGRYYYLTTGTKLATLLNAGSRSASTAGLVETTVRTDQIADSGTVDIGFHHDATAPELTVECHPFSIVLRWSLPPWLEEMAAAGYITDFKIYRCSVSSGSCTPSTTVYATVDDPQVVADPTQWTFTDTALTSGNVYCYRVRYRHVDACDSSLVYESPLSTTRCNDNSDGPFWTDYDGTAQQLAEWIMAGSGISVVANSATFTGAAVAKGTFGNGYSAGLPINSGVILSSGDILLAPHVNDDSGATADNGEPGDDDLNGLVTGVSTADAAVLEFDITSPTATTLEFQYIFASEEYPEWIGEYSQYGFA